MTCSVKVHREIKTLLRRLRFITALVVVSVSLPWQVVGLHEVCVAHAGLGG